MCLCDMQPRHRILALRSAMALCYKAKNFLYAAYCAKKLIQLEDLHPGSTKPDVIANAKKLYSACEAEGRNETRVDFEDAWLYDNNFVVRVCAKSLKIIKGVEPTSCSFSGARYYPEFEGQLDDVSGVCQIGAQILGLKIVQ
eukprot:TRINITY_DN10475_c0_g1_i1.p1 TRINITY_DN10475_c0_g1~~TRINITY_DN10475_c0_g1_i1.p1  ORF type:complete len:142 (-),score=22.22 TRINITY_DN10475_c0_g1_i1:142-567(-)